MLEFPLHPPSFSFRSLQRTGVLSTHCGFKDVKLIAHRHNIAMNTRLFTQKQSNAVIRPKLCFLASKAITRTLNTQQYVQSNNMAVAC